MKIKKQILFLLHLPPPIHGSSIMGKYISESEYLRNFFLVEFINLSASNTVSETGKVTFIKLIGLLKTFLQLIKHIFYKKWVVTFQ